MIRLISKIQYSNYETGEFSEEKERTFDEVKDVIEKFPWEKQRKGITIDLTNPSVTIHGKKNDYLKLSLFYNGRFVLYYLNQEGELSVNGFDDFRDAYVHIKHGSSQVRRK
ncbi:hypothetical protein [Pollutibacter soli]|uniref:hypothetical protein n=1 Tax=Pollutibacter soli TaxID=3034157 RepID=UPI0030139DA1